ncbi:MAG: AMP phosphorylase [Candidatus Bathyarchaeia archaeon]
MDLRVREMNVDSGGPLIAVLNVEDSEELGVRSQGRVAVSKGSLKATAIVNTTRRIIEKGEIGVYDELRDRLRVRSGDLVEVSAAPSPKSLNYIRSKLRGRALSRSEIYEIIRDTVNGILSDVEIASFVTALHFRGLDLEEAINLSRAMVETGKTLQLGDGLIVDKHSIGGVPGDKTTLLVVPIVASLGLTIPKSSSRAITSAAGTADRAEVIMPVNLTVEEIKRVLEKSNGCIVWGGALDLSPADDIFVKVEFPLSIDPLLLPSILSKKKAVGAKLLVMDIPCGWGAKVKTLEEAQQLARDFIELGSRLDMNVRCLITHGGQPIGYSIGPALEAREALENLSGASSSEDLIDKATDIAGNLFEMAGHPDGKQKALAILKSGKAEEKMREIIALQGGDPYIKPEDIPLGGYRYDVNSETKGYVIWMNNHALVEIARKAGAPKDKGAGIRLYRKTGDPVDVGETLFTIFAEKESKLSEAISELEENRALQVGRRMEMTMDEVKAVTPGMERFILER